MKTKLLKSLVAVVITLFMLMSVTMPVFADTTSDAVSDSAIAIESSGASEVRLYQHRDFKGLYQRFPVGGATVNSIGSRLKNQVSSVYVPPGATVHLTDREGKKNLTLRDSVRYVGSDMDNRADEVAITQSCRPGSSVC
jgi:hypothetical protein